ncbi:hypothetical protein ACFVEN_44180 [Streptomyces sp. NPDC057681]|uniref:hypothetical protein n=1 Tax=Streptomyces sp. NPDC057681 TaxID=3346209 RepID=UPI0036A69470
MAYDETQEIQETAHVAARDVVAESIRLAITLAAIVAEEVVRARERRYELERQASEERARLDVERLRAERAAAEPLLRSVHQDRFWRDLDPTNDEHRRRLGRTWQAASEWAAGDPYAAYTLDALREQLRDRFGIDTPEWPLGGAELSRMVALAHPEFRAHLDKAREAAAEAGTVSYSVIIRDRDDPYTIAYQGEATVSAGMSADEAAARAYADWAAGSGAATVEGRGDRFDVELRENTGTSESVAVPAAVLASGLAPEVLAAAESRRRSLVVGTETGTDAELLLALTEHLDRLEAEEAHRTARREEYVGRLAEPGLSDADRTRLQGNIEAIDSGLPGLRQEQADTALRTAATAAQMRGENPAHVYAGARLSDSLDEEWWDTASAAEIAGVWDHVGAWQEGQARSEMQAALRVGIERHHRLLVPEGATGDVVAGLYGGKDMPGPAVPLSTHGEALREQAHALYEAAFDDYGAAAVQRAEADQAEGDAATALRTRSELLTERAEQSSAQATRLMEQGTWLDTQTPEALRVLYRESSAAAVDELAARFEQQWGRPLIPQAREQLVEAAAQLEPSGPVYRVTTLVGSADPTAVTVPGGTPTAHGRGSATVDESTGLESAEELLPAAPEAASAPPFQEPAGGAVSTPGDGFAAGEPSHVPDWMEDPQPAATTAPSTPPVQTAAQVAGGAAKTLGGAATAVEESVAPDRTQERRAAATTALESVGDEEARHAADLARKAFPEGPEGAVASPPQSGRGSGGAGPSADRERGAEVQL